MSKLTMSEIQNSLFADETYYINKLFEIIPNGTQVSFEKDTYNLRVTYAKQELKFISNNDTSIKSLAFHLNDKKDITIDGGGATLNCIGRILPFYLENSQNITIKNFVIDYARPFSSQGEVVASTANTVTLKIDKEQYPYVIKHGTIRFTGEDYDSFYVHGLLEFYKEEKRPVNNVKDITINGSLCATAVDDGNVMFTVDRFAKQPEVGNILTIKHEHRYIPAIVMDKCKNIKLENIWIKHAGAMAVVAQLTENISLDNVSVYPDPADDRVFSANADATHFVNCYGEVVVENGRYEGMFDDIINVHGNYLRVEKVFDNSTVLVCIPHYQQEGYFNCEVGNNISICEQETMLTKGLSKISNLTRLNQKYWIMKLETPFEFDEQFVYCIDNLDFHPVVKFRNNSGGKNRARGLILTSRQDMFIENNVLDTEGSCIKVNSDMERWYESSNISNLYIRDNVLIRRNSINWGEALIDIDPWMHQVVEGEYFHGNVFIENNDITLDGTPLVYGYSFTNLVLKNNKVNSSEPVCLIKNYNQFISS